jgi:hypothetical protein
LIDILFIDFFLFNTYPIVKLPVVPIQSIVFVWLEEKKRREFEVSSYVSRLRIGTCDIFSLDYLKKLTCIKCIVACFIVEGKYFLSNNQAFHLCSN